jgi:hypothetical protein
MAERIGRLRKSGNLETLRQERRKQELLRPNRGQPAPALHNRRRSAMEQEWEFFKLGMQQGQIQQQQQAALRYRQQLIDEIGRIIRPLQEPEIIVVEERTESARTPRFQPRLDDTGA